MSLRTFPRTHVSTAIRKSTLHVVAKFPNDIETVVLLVNEQGL